MARAQHTARDEAASAFNDVLWPAARAGEALRLIARHAGLTGTDAEVSTPRSSLDADEFATWLRAAADCEGLHADQQLVSLDRIGSALVSAPAIFRVGMPGNPEAAQFLAVVGSRGSSLLAIAPDQRVRHVAVSAAAEMIRAPFVDCFTAEVEPVVVALGLSADARDRARRALIGEHLSGIRTAGCWLLRAQPGAGFREAAGETGVLRGTALLVSAHLAQSVLFVASWWLLGRSLMQGTIDRGWLMGWLLLLVSVIPFRLASSWLQGVMAVSVGAWLRRRLLRGAMNVERQTVRASGAGRFFSVIAEAEAVESLTLNGGVLSLLSAIELLLAGAVLWAGAGVFAFGLLAAWTTFAGWVAWRAITRRRSWTEERLGLTDDLVEVMVGHRTRLAQQPAERWHQREDDAVERYISSAAAMDAPDLWLTAIVPRGWLALAVAVIAPAALAGATPGRLAVAIGGVILAYRALRRLVSGVSDVAGAVIAARAVVPLLRAAARRESPTSPSMAVSSAVDSPDIAVADARGLTFRHRAGGEPVLHDCNLRLARGSHVLLEGASGSGKTTLASILAGLSTAESGVLLAGGLDRSVLGAAGWRRRIVLAPQPHDNYLVGSTLAFNLLMGKRWPARPEDLEEAERVCRELGLGELLDQMPAGLHQVVGETGWQLSQGERARVFLARAILQRPDLLILDESFSALDPENVDRAVRCVVQQAPTVLAIAHP